MARLFKNALCLAAIPDIGGYGYHGEQSPHQVRCRRRTNHLGKHRVRFSDGWREWAEGDLDSISVEEPCGASGLHGRDRQRKRIDAATDLAIEMYGPALRELGQR